MFTETNKITLTKMAERTLRDKPIQGQMGNLIASVQTKSLYARGWSIGQVADSVKQLPSKDPDYLYQYTITLYVDYSHAGHAPERNDLPSILRTMYARAEQPAYGSWTLTHVNDEPYEPPAAGDVVTTNDLIGYSEVKIPANFESFFSHLYGLDAHVARIKAALQAGIQSGWRNRYHCVLQGPPGCGKSDICRSLKNALGEDAVMEFDATATTAAGAIQELAELQILPRVLIVEEIEKADPASLGFLLAVCDLRGEIRKTTARQKINRNTKLFVVATVNDVSLFNKLQAGALSSRFANKIWFKRPSREQLAMILNREIDKVDGDPAWVTPALDYCLDHDIKDPRIVSSVCLCGREKLLNGEFQAMMAATDESNLDEDEREIALGNMEEF